MTDAYRTPGRDIDMTEIERTKIHEAAETKRAEISEREKTKREAQKYRSQWWSAHGFAMSVSLMVFLAISGVIAGINVHAWIESTHPPPPFIPSQSCSETVEVVSSWSSIGHCDKGGHITTEKLERGEVLWHCHCPSPSAAITDGGVP